MAQRTGRRPAPLPHAGAAVPVARELRIFKERSGKTYDELARRAQYTKTALSIAASGKRLPSWDVVKAFVRACGATEAEIAGMNVIWEKARVDSQVTRTVVDDRTARAEEPAFLYLNADPRMILHREGFNVALEQIRVELGLSVNEVIERSKLPARPGERALQLRRTHVYDVLSGRARPSELFVELFLVACGMPQRQRRDWLQQFNKLKEEERRASEALAVLRKNGLEDTRERALQALNREYSDPHEPGSVYRTMDTVQLDLELSTESIDDAIEAEIVEAPAKALAIADDDVLDAEIVDDSAKGNILAQYKRPVGRYEREVRTRSVKTLKALIESGSPTAMSALVAVIEGLASK
jgi:transcriptional regulator with XRE-family HTH domain